MRYVLPRHQPALYVRFRKPTRPPSRREFEEAVIAVRKDGEDLKIFLGVCN